ncbi:kinase-like domain-containing protein, partial [Cantharellus anzutake]|uniref:kinase-like domain-containing protein n=1 Tax=Cantharellus anzutake TaxID=1750568 RepID=UPI001909046C
MLALNTVVDGGRFHILDILGKGGSGVAYLAFDLHRSTSNTAKYYAIKCLLRKSDQSDLLREVQLHKCVSKHENIVTLRRCVPEGQFQILIMDYCADGDLFRLIIQQHRYFGNDELIKDVFLQIIDAVAYCHSRGIYHRDLKPENILCSHDGTKVYLTDFGLATQEPISHDVGIGSGYYMSPECNAGPKYDSAMNDVWSLGVILMNLCYGRNPWARADLLDETFRAFLSDPNYLASILPIPPAVNSILKGLFALNPGCRMTLDQLRTAILKVDHFIMS